MRRHRLLSIVLTLALVATPTLAPNLALANEGKKEKKEAVTYFALAPINAVIMRRDGRRGVITLETGLEVKDPELMKRAQASSPRLRAAFAQVLTGWTSVDDPRSDSPTRFALASIALRTSSGTSLIRMSVIRHHLRYQMISPLGPVPPGAGSTSLTFTS